MHSAEIIAAVDSLKNPFDHTTRAQEELVIEAALAFAKTLSKEA